MQYTITINQKAIIDAEIPIDLTDAAILTVLLHYGHSSACVKVEYMVRIYHWFDHGKIASELPLSGLKKDSVYRRMKKMCELGLLRQHPDNEKLGKSFYMFEDITLGLYSDSSENNPQTLGKRSIKPSDKKPTDHNTIDHNTIIINSSSEQIQKPTELNLKIIDYKETAESTLEEKIIKRYHSFFCAHRTIPGKTFDHKTLMNQKMDAWKKELHGIMKIDKRTKDELYEMLQFIKKSKDPFWRNTIYSLGGIRKHWDIIRDKMMAETEKAKQQPQETEERVFQGKFNIKK